MQINENAASIVRSLVIGGVALAVLGPIGSLTASFRDMSALNLRNAERKSELTYFESAKETLQAQLTLPCIDWIFSEGDTAVEKRAETEIDKVFNGETDYRAVCQFILN